MFFWFLGAGVAIVWVVFQSPALDYRLVMLGAVVPLLDAVTGGPWVLHTLLASVVVLTLVMLATRRHRLRRRQMLGVAIGMFVHLVLDGTWTRKELFWWPAFGPAFTGQLPEMTHGALSIVLECAGIGLLVWLWQRFGFARPDVRARFLRTGQLPRDRVG